MIAAVVAVCHREDNVSENDDDDDVGDEGRQHMKSMMRVTPLKVRFQSLAVYRSV